MLKKQELRPKKKLLKLNDKELLQRKNNDV